MEDNFTFRSACTAAAQIALLFFIATQTTTAQVIWRGSDGVGKIVVNKCGTCHNNNQVYVKQFQQVLNLWNYNEAEAGADGIKKKLEHHIGIDVPSTNDIAPYRDFLRHKMPLWSPDTTGGYLRLAHPRTIDSQTVVKFSDWITGGKIKGMGSEPLLVKKAEIPANQHELKINNGNPYTVNAFTSDVIVIFPLVANFDTTRWIKRIQFVPGSNKVHHMVLGVDAHDTSFPDAPQINQSGGKLIAAWAPGESNIMDFPCDMGLQLDANHSYKLQIHYVKSIPSYSDTTSIRIEYFNQPPQRILYADLISGATSSENDTNSLFGFVDSLGVPISNDSALYMRENQGDKNITHINYPFKIQGNFYNFPSDSISILKVLPHAHLRTVQMQIDIVEANTIDTSKLIKLPFWNFDNQVNYMLYKPLRVFAGSDSSTKIIMKGIINNTFTHNPNIDHYGGYVNNQECTAGDFSDQEMFSAFFTYTQYLHGDDTLILESPAFTADIELDTDNFNYVTLTPYAGKPPYNFLWADNDTSRLRVNVAAGTHQVSISDANGCWYSYEFTIPSALAPCVSSSLHFNLAFGDNQTIYSSTLPSNVFVNDTIYIGRNATLIIDSFASFTNSEIILGANAQIIVDTGAKLILENAYLHGCDSFWQGIRVHGKMNEYQYIYNNGTSNQGYLIINNSLIAGAENAIRVYNPVWSSTNLHGGGGIVQATNSTFRNNRRDVEFLKHQNVFINIWLDNRSFFRNCSFETTAALPQGKNPSAHVTMWATKGIRFEGCTFENKRTSGITALMQLGDGIQSIDAGYRLIENPANPSDKTIFKNLNYGIKTGNAVYLQPVLVQNCMFDNVFRGATLNKADFSVVTNNTFKVGRTNQLTSFDLTNAPYGLGFNYSTQFTCTGNYFAKASGASAISTGAWYSNTGGMENQSRDNSFENLPVGQLTNGTNRNIATISNPAVQGLQLLCNNHTRNGLYDIVVMNRFFGDDGLPTGQEGVRDLQGVLGSGSVGDVAARNTFSNPSQLDGNLGNYGTNIRYVVDSSYQNEFPLQIDSNKVKYVLVQDTITTCSYPITLPGRVKFSPELVKILKENFATHKMSYQYYGNLLDTLIDGGNTANVVNDIITAFPNGAWQLRDELIGMSPFLSDSVLFAAISRQDVFSHADLFEFLVANPDGFWTNYAAAEAFLDTTAMPQWMVDFLWNMHDQGQTVTYRTLLQSYRAQHSEEMFFAWKNIVTDILMDSAGYEPDTLIHWLANIEHYEAEALLALTLFNTGHDSVTDYTGNFTAFLEAEYEVTENPALIDIAQMNELTDFFINFGTDFSDSLHQDIFTSGMVAELPYSLSTFRRVRNLADFFTAGVDTARYDDNPIFPDEVFGKKEKESVKDARARRRAAAAKLPSWEGQGVGAGYTKAYPNPAGRIVTVEYALPKDIDNAELVIADMNGRIAYRKPLIIKQYLYNIDVSEWVNGIYYYKISNEDTQVGSGKIVVIK